MAVYECCNKVYPCSKCHDNNERHQRKKDYPSKRFCLKCYEFYKADCT